jgi:hypothetical protein
MENEQPQTTNRYYLYVGSDSRLIAIREYKLWYTPIREFRYEIFDGFIPENIKQYIHHFGYITSNGEVMLVRKETNSTDIIDKCKEEALELHIWELFELFVVNYTKLYTKNFIDIMTDFYILDEIRLYNFTGEVGTFLSNFQKNNEYNYSLDDIIKREMMKIEDKKNIMFFLNNQRSNIKKLVSEKNYEEALSYIKQTHKGW